MDEPIETELKIELDGAADPASLLGLKAGTHKRLAATYFDTPDQDLRARGYSLRIRRDGRTRIQTVKAAGAGAGLFVRPEWERPLSGDSPILDEAAGPLAQIFDEALLQRLAPVFTTDIDRTLWEIELDGARVELAHDRGMVSTGGRSAAVNEIEFELREGDPAALFALARRLDPGGAIRLGVLTKAERGYLLAEPEPRAAFKAEPIALDREGDARDGFAAIAASCIRHFRRNEALLFDGGGPAALHQARVGLRRLRSAFSLFSGLFEGDARADLLRAELKWLAAELGEVRNLDVMIPRHEAATRLALEEERARRFAQVRAHLDSARTRLLMIDLAEWLACGAWRTDPADPALAGRALPRIAEDILDRHRKRLERRGHRLSRLDDEDRHRVRIEAKKLRYATEFFASLFPGKKARRRHAAFLDAMEALQDVLGLLNDQATAPEVYRHLGLAPPPAAADGDRAALLAEAEEAHERLVDAKRFWR